MAAPGEVLPAVVTAVAESLRLPYVAIERPADGSVLTAFGDPAAAGEARAERWPLSYQGVTVGTLVAGPRRGEQAFDPRDRAVLGDIARQAGAAVHAEALTADLLDSRQRLVSAREEERRRLRRELHDGLGPLLTGVGLNIDAARARAERGLGRDGEENEDLGVLLGRAREATAQAITDLRGIVYGLRPSSLDDLGLAGAIAAHIQRLGEGTSMQITLDAGQLTDLPAAVEVATFRIAVEAVNNVVRHSRAQNCQVRLRVDNPGSCRRDPRRQYGRRAMGGRRGPAGDAGARGRAGRHPDRRPGTGGGTVRACFPLPAKGAS